MLKLGDYNKLVVVKRVDFGLYLDGGKAGEILLPSRYVPENAEIGDEIEVFIYLDQDERIIATTERPLAKVGEFAYLEVKWINASGAFLGWGLMKDVFCPFREQKKKMQIGESYIVYIHIDEESYRIMASAKVEKFLKNNSEFRIAKQSRAEGESEAAMQNAELKKGDEVDLLVWQKTDLGFKVIINNQFAGLIYDDQIFDRIHTGNRMKGYIQAIRPDGKIDVALQRTGRQQTLDFSDTLLNYMRAHEGFCPFGDKSEADEIYRQFHVSKKVFKKAIGDLYKKRLITVKPLELRLT